VEKSLGRHGIQGKQFSPREARGGVHAHHQHFILNLLPLDGIKLREIVELTSRGMISYETPVVESQAGNGP